MIVVIMTMMAILVFFFTRRLFITIPRDITTAIMTHRMWIPEFLAVYSVTEDAVASAGTLHVVRHSPLAQSRTQLFTCFGSERRLG